MAFRRISTAFTHLILLGVASYYLAKHLNRHQKDFRFSSVSFVAVIFNSLVGLLNYGFTSSGSTVARAFDRTSTLAVWLFLPFFNTELWLTYQTNVYYAYGHIAIAFLLLLTYPQGMAMHQAEDLIVFLNLISLAYISQTFKNYYGWSLIVSYAFARFVIREKGIIYDVPSPNLYNMCMCFTCLFAGKMLD